MTIGELINIAFGELDYTEGKNNDNKYGIWYGMNNQPWCMIFQQWCFNQGGGSSLILRTASCGSLYNWAKNNRKLYSVPYYPGDLVIFTFKKDKNGNPETNHVGLILGLTKDGKYVYTIEGNTSAGSSGSQANGDCVAFKKRPISQIYGKKVIRPKYKDKKVKKVQNNREITVWTAPAKLDLCRERTIKPQEIQVYDELIPSFTKEGDYFYRTIKNRFVLAKYCEEVQK